MLCNKVLNCVEYLKDHELKVSELEGKSKFDESFHCLDLFTMDIEPEWNLYDSLRKSPFQAVWDSNPFTFLDEITSYWFEERTNAS